MKSNDTKSLPIHNYLILTIVFLVYMTAVIMLMSYDYSYRENYCTMVSFNFSSITEVILED